MRKTLAALVAAVGLIWGAAAPAQDLKLLASWDTSYAPVEAVIDPLAARISEATGGKVKFTRFGPETIPPFEQFDPVDESPFLRLPSLRIASCVGVTRSTSVPSSPRWVASFPILRPISTFRNRLRIFLNQV